jgi:hypothetical protein
MTVAGMTLPNEASVGLPRAMGFEPVGLYRRIGWKFGAWHDVAWMQRALGIELDPPPSPAEATARIRWRPWLSLLWDRRSRGEVAPRSRGRRGVRR